MNTLIWVVSGVLVSAAGGTVLLDLRNRRIAYSRRGEGYEDFRRHFAGQGIEEPITSSVYHYFEDWMQSALAKEFPVQPADMIDDIYGIVDEDVEDMLKDVLEKANRRLPNENEMKPPVDLQTVGDVVEFVAQCPKQVS